MGDAKDEFSLTDLRTKSHNFFLLHNLLGRLHIELAFSVHKRNILTFHVKAETGRSTMMKDRN